VTIRRSTVIFYGSFITLALRLIRLSTLNKKEEEEEEAS